MKRNDYHSLNRQMIYWKGFMLFILIALFSLVLGCEFPEGRYDGPDTGSIAIQAIWPDETISDQGVIVSDLTCPSCTEFAGSVYAADLDPYVYFNFPFSDHYGVVYNVPWGYDRCVYADARDGSGNVYFNGDSCGIYVPGGGSSGTVTLLMREVYGWLMWEDPPNNDLYEADYVTDIPYYDTSVTLTGEISPEADVDWFYFWIDAGTQVGFDCDAEEYGSYMDCELTLYDSGYSQIDYNDDGTDPDTALYCLDSYISHDFSGGDYYYLKIRDLSGEGGYGWYYNINVRVE